MSQYRPIVRVSGRPSELADGDTLLVANIPAPGSSGYVQFSDGANPASDSGLFWDNANKRLGIGTIAPTTPLHVAGKGAFGDSVTASNTTRALNLCSTDAVLRVLRISPDIATAAPGVELIHRTSADGASDAYWDVYVGVGNKLNFRRRTGGGFSGDLDVLTCDPTGETTIPLLYPQNLDNVLFADTFAGADIGAQIIAAYNHLPADGGEIFVAGRWYLFDTPIVFQTPGKIVLLRGVPGATFLQYTGISGVAITMDYTPPAGGGGKTGHGIRDISLYCGAPESFVNGGPNKIAQVTAWSIDGSNIATLTANNTFSAGDSITLDGFPTATFFNGQTVTVLSSGLSGTQFKANFTHAADSATEYGLGYTTTVSAVGIRFGGTYGGAQNGNVENVLVGGFLNNFEFSTNTPSSNSWGMLFNKCSSGWGTFGYRFPEVVYENMRIHSGIISANGVGISMGQGSAVDLSVSGVSFDVNTVCGFYASGPGGSASFSDCHWENYNEPNAHFINSGLSNTAVNRGFVLDDNSAGTLDWLFRFSGNSAYVQGVELFAGQTVTQAVLLANSCQTFVAVHSNSSNILAVVGGSLTNLMDFSAISGGPQPRLPNLTIVDWLKTGVLFPAADSTTAVKINKADGYTNVLVVDTTNGWVGIGVGSPAYRLEVNGEINAVTDYRCGGTVGVSAGPFTAITGIQSVGGIVTALTGTSDERLKDAVAYEGGLDEVLAIHPVKYHWNEAGQKHTGFNGAQEFVGFTAQDVKKAIPQAITATEGKEQYLSLDDRPIIAALVNAVKELEARIKVLEDR